MEAGGEQEQRCLAWAGAPPPGPPTGRRKGRKGARKAQPRRFWRRPAGAIRGEGRQAAGGDQAPVGGHAVDDEEQHHQRPPAVPKWRGQKRAAGRSCARTIPARSGTRSGEAPARRTRAKGQQDSPMRRALFSSRRSRRRWAARRRRPAAGPGRRRRRDARGCPTADHGSWLLRWSREAGGSGWRRRRRWC